MLVPKAATVEATTYPPVAPQTTPNLPQFAMVPWRSGCGHTCVQPTARDGSTRPTSETYIKVKGRWVYLYRAVDSRGQTIDFRLSAKRDAQTAKRFFRKALARRPCCKVFSNSKIR
jgi:hypothetical protein